MINNKKAQVIVLRIMIGIIIFIFALALVKPTAQAIEAGTNTTNLNCSSSDLSSGDNAACVVTEQGLFWLIGVIIAMSISVITGGRTPVGIITSIFLFIVIVMLIEPLKGFIIHFRSADYLNCAATSITTSAKMTCLVVDIWLFWFIAVCLGALGVLFFNTKLKEKIPFLQDDNEK